MTSRTNLMHSLPVVAKALGRKYGLSVEVGGTQAFTDGDTIHLPSLPPDDREAAALAYGFLDHEAGHLRLTKFEVLSQAKSPLHKVLFNIFEDIRVEKEMGQIFPGCRINLESLIRKLVADHFFDEPTSKGSPAAILQAFLLYELRVQVLHQNALIPLSQASEDLLRQLTSGELIQRLLKVMNKVDALTSSKESMALAEEVLRLLKQEMEGPASSGGDRRECGNPQDLKQGDGGQENRGPENHPPSAVQRNPQHFPAPQSSTHSESQRVESKLGEERGTAGYSQSEESQPSIDTESAQPAVESPGSKRTDRRRYKAPRDKALRKMLQASESELTRDFGEMLAERLAREGEQACKDGFRMAVAIRPPAAVASQIGQEVSQQTRALRVRLDGLIQASRLDRSRLASTGIRINTGELYRLALSDPQVFSRLRKRNAINTAVQILLDKSDSMRHRLEIARKAALAVACALQYINGTAVACAAFPVVGVGNAVGILPLTRFDERVAVTASRYESFDAQGGTPLAEAL